MILTIASMSVKINYFDKISCHLKVILVQAYTFCKLLFLIVVRKIQMVEKSDHLDLHILYSKNPILFNHQYRKVLVEQISS